MYCIVVILRNETVGLVSVSAVESNLVLEARSKESGLFQSHRIDLTRLQTDSIADIQYTVLS